jgi:hypothetical protein
LCEFGRLKQCAAIQANGVSAQPILALLDEPPLGAGHPAARSVIARRVSRQVIWEEEAATGRFW